MILPDWFGNKKVFLAARSLGTLSLSQIRSWLFKGRETANQLIRCSKHKKQTKKDELSTCRKPLSPTRKNKNKKLRRENIKCYKPVGPAS